MRSVSETGRSVTKRNIAMMAALFGLIAYFGFTSSFGHDVRDFARGAHDGFVYGHE